MTHANDLETRLRNHFNDTRGMTIAADELPLLMTYWQETEQAQARVASWLAPGAAIACVFDPRRFHAQK